LGALRSIDEMRRQVVLAREPPDEAAPELFQPKLFRNIMRVARRPSRYNLRVLPSGDGEEAPLGANPAPPTIKRTALAVIQHLGPSAKRVLRRVNRA
jgi:hypothetical protein